MARRYALVLALSLMVIGTAISAALAQTGGQLWVRAFEDRNRNGARDAGEPLLTRGISVNLLNADGVIIASALLDNSPNAAQGLVGFQLLPAGEYAVQITSADYTTTTSDSFTTAVSDTGVPPVLEYGAVRAELSAEDAVATTETATVEAQTGQLVIAAAGALAVVCVMAVLGIIVYFFTLRSRLLAAQAADRRLTTGSMRPVRMTDTGSFRVSDTGSFRVSDTGSFRVSDTGQFRRPAGPDTGQFQRPDTGQFSTPRDPDEPNP